MRNKFYLIKLLLIFLTLLLISSCRDTNDSSSILIITCRENTIYRKNENGIKERNVVQHRIYYRLDNRNNEFTTHDYEIETYKELLEGETYSRDESVSRAVVWENKVPGEFFTQFSDAIRSAKEVAASTTGERDTVIFYIDIVENRQTTSFIKKGDFNRDLPWNQKGQQKSILNPSIDSLVHLLLPSEFLNKEQLKVEFNQTH